MAYKMKYLFLLLTVFVAVGCTQDATIGTSVGPQFHSYMVLVSGQSNAYGHGTTAMRTAQPFSALTNATVLYGDVTVPAAAVGFASVPLVPLREIGTETIDSALADYLAASTRSQVLIGNHAQGSSRYSLLAKGTRPYINGQAQAQNFFNFPPNSTTETPLGVAIVHGESDYSEGLTGTYAANLATWQADYEADVNSMFTRVGTLPMFQVQFTCADTGTLAAAQWAATQANPTKIITIGPRYQFAMQPAERIHLNTADMAYLGELFGKVIKSVGVDGQPWTPLSPTTVVRSGATITVSLSIPVSPLVIDTTNVAARTSYGFEFTQTGGNAVSISSVALTNGNTQIAITLSDTPTGTNQRLRYAYTCPSAPTSGTSCCGADSSSYVGGNIRDSDMSVSPSYRGTRRPLYNWLISFDEAVI